MPKLRILCVFTKILGNKNLSAWLLEILEEDAGLSLQKMFFEGEDYRRYPAPAFARFSEALESGWVMKKKYAAERDKLAPFDALFFQSFHLIAPLGHLIRKTPTAVSLDITPVLGHRLLLNTARSPLARLRSRISIVLSRWVFGAKFRRVDVFLPCSTWCAESLKNDFGISEDRIRVTHFPLNLERWVPGADEDRSRGHDKLPIMLFVGNDFERKGGPFLLELFDKHLQGKYRLRIVSGDPVVKSIESRDGLEVFSDITYEKLDELISLYQTSDVFVFPTFLDAFGIVIGEAIATAMPVVARNVGGIPDFVKDGQTGRLMPYESGLEEWRDVLLALAGDPEERTRLGRNGRALAEEKMSATAVREQVRSAVDVLSEKARDRGLD